MKVWTVEIWYTVQALTDGAKADSVRYVRTDTAASARKQIAYELWDDGQDFEVIVVSEGV